MSSVTLAAVPGLASTDAATRRELVAMSKRLGMKPDWPNAIISFETNRTWSPKARNPISGATGLIQFMPSTARGLGTSVEQLARMTALEQLAWVEKYFRPFVGRLHNLGDAYLAVFNSRGMGKPDDFVLFRKGEAGYEQNPGLDPGHTGAITRGSAIAQVEKVLARATERLPVDGPPPARASSSSGGGVLLAAGAFAWAMGWL